MNNMRKLMEAVEQLNEYLLRDGDSVTKLLRLNVFGDTGHTEGDGIAYGPNDVSWEEGELDPQLQKEWLRNAKPYVQKAGKLKNAIMKAAAKGRTLTDAEVNAAENTWYDGSDLYSELELAFEELPGVWDNQLQVVEDILNGEVEEWDGEYGGFGEELEEDRFEDDVAEEKRRALSSLAHILAAEVYSVMRSRPNGEEHREGMTGYIMDQTMKSLRSQVDNIVDDPDQD